MATQPTETLKADRTLMMEGVLALAAKHKVQIVDQYEEGRAIGTMFQAPGGLRVSVDFDGASPQPNVFVLSWHMPFESKRKLDVHFILGGVNMYHQQKATSVCRGFDDLVAELDDCWAKCADGDAYEDQP